MALVLLYQPANRWRLGTHHPYLLSNSSAPRSCDCLAQGKAFTNGSPWSFYCHGRYYLLRPSLAMGRSIEIVEQLLCHWYLGGICPHSGSFRRHRMVPRRTRNDRLPHYQATQYLGWDVLHLLPRRRLLLASLLPSYLFPSCKWCNGLTIWSSQPPPYPRQHNLLHHFRWYDLSLRLFQSLPHRRLLACDCWRRPPLHPLHNLLLISMDRIPSPDRPWNGSRNPSPNHRRPSLCRRSRSLVCHSHDSLRSNNRRCLFRFRRRSGIHQHTGRETSDHGAQRGACECCECRGDDD